MGTTVMAAAVIPIARSLIGLLRAPASFDRSRMAHTGGWRCRIPGPPSRYAAAASHTGRRVARRGWSSAGRHGVAAACLGREDPRFLGQTWGTGSGITLRCGQAEAAGQGCSRTRRGERGDIGRDRDSNVRYRSLHGPTCSTLRARVVLPRRIAPWRAAEFVVSADRCRRLA